MSYYPGPNSHIRDEVLFKFSNYANKKCSRCFKQLKKNKKTDDPGKFKTVPVDSKN